MRNRRRLSAYHLGRDDLRRHLNEIDRFRPAAIYGYASAVYLLAREAIDTGFQCDSLRACILTAEPTYPHMVDTVGLAFSAPVINQYGATECELIAGEDRDGMLRVREDMVLLETLPRPDGGYDIACTELNNSSFPLIRYLIGDVSPAPVDFGEQGFARLQTVDGRCNDCLQSRSGDLIHPGYLIERVKQSGEVGRYQIRQKADGSVEVALETQGGTLGLDRAALVRRLQDALGGYPVEVSTIDLLPTNVAGKHRWIRSELTAQIQATEPREVSPMVPGRIESKSETARPL
jgi:phenylacetate-CoA ligase